MSFAQIKPSHTSNPHLGKEIESSPGTTSTTHQKLKASPESSLNCAITSLTFTLYSLVGVFYEGLYRFAKGAESPRHESFNPISGRPESSLPYSAFSPDRRTVFPSGSWIMANLIPKPVS